MAKRKRARVPQAAKTGGGGVIAVCGMEAARYSECSLAIARLDKPPGWDYWGAWNYDVAHARNLIVDTFLANPDVGDHLFFMDDDHVFDPSILKRLLTNGLPVCGPLVLSRRMPFLPCPMVGDGAETAALDLTRTPVGLVEVDALGAAGLLLHRSVFDGLPRPLFSHGTKADGTHVSDDVAFTRKLKAAGHRLIVDTTVVLGHTGVCHITPAWDGEKWVTTIQTGGATLTLPVYQEQEEGNVRVPAG